MDYREAVSSLFALGKFASAPGMMRMIPLLDGLGNPQEGFDVVHVAGTNGKGSTCAFLESIFRTYGIRAGLFTSPHLQTVRERIRVGQDMISEGDFADIATQVLDLSRDVEEVAGEHPTFFEILTAIMYRYAADQGVDWLIQEVGLGGRYDATNVIPDPRITVITDVDLDHTEVLGTTIAEIAGEKAGIIKRGVPVVTGALHPEAMEVVARTARTLGARVYRVLPGDGPEGTAHYSPGGISGAGTTFDYEGFRWSLSGVRISMLGGHQIRNASLALGVAEILGEDLGMHPSPVLEGLRSARWPGRVEAVSDHPLVILDGAHNPSGARVLARSVAELFSGRTIHSVVGMMGDKDANAMLENLAGSINGRVIATRPPLPRAKPEEELGAAARSILTSAQSVAVQSDPEVAVDEILAHCDPSDVLIIWGSLYLVGAVRGRWIPAGSD